MKSTEKNKKTDSMVKESSKKSKRGEYIDRLTTQLKKWDKELSELEEKSEQQLSKMKGNLAKSVDHFKARRDQLKERLHRIEQAGEEAFKDLREDTEKLWNDTRKAFKAMSKELKK